MFLYLYRTLDLKSSSMDRSHFENNFKRTINCRATRANMNEPSIRSRAVDPEPDPAAAGAKTILQGWSRSQKLLDGGTGA